jgi:hypothetical protein
MITLVFTVLAVLAIGFTVLVSLRPSEFRVVRTARIAAAPATVFSHINDFHKWEAILADHSFNFGRNAAR